LDQAFQKISDELRTQYLLAYYPSERLADSDFRRIQVSVDGLPTGSDFKVRHRTGYYTSKSF
jgi:Ca-activated chloride channel family protein